MDKLTFKEWSILADLETIAPLGEDYEFSMARGELKTAQAAITRLMTKLKGEGDLEAWVQSKITKAAEYLDTVADHLSHGEDDTERTKEVKEGFKGHKSVEEIAKKHKVSPSVIQKQLEMGMKVEHEHTTDNDEAMDIALQHLDEIPNYYSKLKKMEKVKESFSPHEEAMRRSSEKLKKEKKITTAPMVMPRNAVYRPKEDPIKDTSVKEQPKPKAEEKKEPLTALQAAKLRKLEREQNKKQKRRKSVKESLELHDANGNLFATVVDIIKGSDYKFKSFTQPITEDAVEELEDGLKKLDNTSYDSIDKLMRRIMKEHGMTAKELHNAFVSKHDKTPDNWIKDLNEKCWDGYNQVGMKKKGEKVVPNCVKEDSIDEANKSGDSSLRDWFTKSRASDGTPGWVQLGGKYAGQPCAKQPGQTTKPKCGSSKMKADLSDKEEESAFRRKNQEDPNPDRKGKAKMVATEEKDACYSKVKSRYSVWPSAYASGALVKCRKVGAKNWGNKTKKESFELQEMGELQRYCPKCKKNETMKECRYGEEYWKMFSIPTSLAPDPYDPNDIHPANEGVSFDIGSGHKQAQKQAKIRNLATGTTNPNEKSAALRKLSGPSLPLADSYSNWRQELGEDWQSVNRKDKTDGLSQKAVDAYRRENPGSKLQTAVTEKKPTGKRAKRRSNFCSRMKGMKSKLTSAKTSRDPDSRINKALRRWNCN